MRKKEEKREKKGIPNKYEKERERGRTVKDRIRPRLVPVLFALIAPRYNSILLATTRFTPSGRYVRSNKRRSVQASIISIWRASMRRKRETGRALAAAERKRRRGQSGCLSA